MSFDQFGGADPADKVVATAVSAKQTVLVEVNGLGFVSGVRLLDGSLRNWDSRTINDRVKAVAAVAHDRCHAAGDDETLARVAEAERRLNF